MPQQRERLVRQFIDRARAPVASINTPGRSAITGARVHSPGLRAQRRPFRSAEVTAANPHASGALAGAKRTDFTKTNASGDTFRYHAYKDPRTGKRTVFRVGGETNRKLT